MADHVTSITQNRRSNLVWWLFWAGTTTVSGTIAIAVVDALILGLYPEEFNYRNDNQIGPLSMWGCAFVIVIAPLVGVAQALILRTLVALRSWGNWVLLSAIGIFVAIVITILLGLFILTGAGDEDYWPIIWATLPGLVLGLAQWLALRAVTPRATWWVLIVSIAWVCGAVASRLVRDAIFVPVPHSYPFYPAEAAFQWGVGWAVAALVFGVITGGGLLALLPNRKADNLQSNMTSQVTTDNVAQGKGQR